MDIKKFLDSNGVKIVWDKTNDLLEAMADAMDDALAEKAPINNAALTGTPTAPTADAATENTQIATTEFVHDVFNASFSSQVVITITPAQNATIKLTNQISGTEFTGTTNALGIAYITVDEIGQYNISYTSSGRILGPSTIGIGKFNHIYSINGLYQSSVTYTVRINLNDSNPLSSLVYQDDAIGMTKGSSSWDDKEIFKNIKPCLLKNGEVQYYLDKNNFNLKEDGATPSVLTGADGDVMIEFPKFAYRIYEDKDDTAGTDYLYISVSTDEEKIQADSRYHYYAFSDEEEGDCYHFYYGAYKGSLIDNKLRSITGQLPANTKTIGAFNDTAKANGDGYMITGFFQLTAVQCLYLIKYGTRNGQTALGNGVVSVSAAIATGGTENKGMYFGSTSDSATHVKFAGIEDFWGNIWEWVIGLTTDANRQLLTDWDYDGDLGREKFIFPSGLTEDSSGYTTRVAGTTEAGFMSIKHAGSATTHWCDGGDLYAGRVLVFGGRWNDGSYAGPFDFYAADSASSASASVGARLMFLKKSA